MYYAAKLTLKYRVLALDSFSSLWNLFVPVKIACETNGVYILFWKSSARSQEPCKSQLYTGSGSLHWGDRMLFCQFPFEYFYYSEVPICESSVIIAISSPHRRESLQAVQYAIDALKATVPIRKKVFTMTSVRNCQVICLQEINWRYDILYVLF